MIKQITLKAWKEIWAHFLSTSNLQSHYNTPTTYTNLYTAHPRWDKSVGDLQSDYQPPPQKALKILQKENYIIS